MEIRLSNYHIKEIRYNVFGPKLAELNLGSNEETENSGETEISLRYLISKNYTSILAEAEIKFELTASDEVICELALSIDFFMDISITDKSLTDGDQDEYIINRVNDSYNSVLTTIISSSINQIMSLGGLSLNIDASYPKIIVE